MRQISASEAKTRFLQLLDDVEGGDSLIITRHGKRVARLIPDADRQQAAIHAAIEDLRAFGRSNGPIAVKDLLSARDEGRKR